MAKFRFADVDHAEYGDQWYEVNVWQPQNIDAGVLEQWEEATGFVLFGDYTEQLERRSIKSLRAMCWLAHLIDGGDTEWDDFRPQVHRIQWDAGDAKGEATGPNRAARRASTRSKAARSASTSTNTTSA